jgi:hypothetical protein
MLYTEGRKFSPISNHHKSIPLVPGISENNTAYEALSMDLSIE